MIMQSTDTASMRRCSGMGRVRIAVLLVVMACGPSSTNPANRSDVIAFVDVTVVPMDRETRLLHHTVIVQRGRIASLGPVVSTPIPDGALQIDGHGKFLMPGLADMHVHTYDPRQLAMFVTMGVTTIRVLWGDAGTIGARDAIKNGEQRLAPTIYSAGGIIDGNPPIWPGSIAVSTPDEGIEAVAAQQRAGYDFVKVYALLPVEIYDAIVAAAAKHGLPVVGHVPFAAKLGHVLDAKQRSIEHLDGYAAYAERDDSPIKSAKDYKTRMAAYKYSDAAKLAEAVARTKAAGTWNCPTLVVRDRIANLDRPDRTRPEYRFVPPSHIEHWDPKQDFRFQNSTADDFVVARAGNTWGLTVVKALSDAGAGLLAGTDVGNPWLVPGFSLHQELALLVEAKLTPYQALRAATLAPAEFINPSRAARFGTVTVGGRADLVLVEADPLIDIANTTRIAGVMLRGRWLPAPDLVAERERIAAIYRGERSRFDAPPPGPEPIFQARFRDAGPISGEERVTAHTRNGELSLVGEMRLDGEGDVRWELELGSDGMGRHMRVVQDGLELVMVRGAGQVRVTGRLGTDKVSFEEPIAADEIFGGAALGADVAHQRQLMSLAIGGAVTLKLAVLEVRPAIAIRRMTISATRLADAQRTIAGKSIAVRVFTFSVFGGTGELVLDADGWPVSTLTATRLE